MIVQARSLTPLRLVKCSGRFTCMPGQRPDRVWASSCSVQNKAWDLKVLQWNVLADGLAQHGDFVKVPEQALCWSYRAGLLMQEILESQADIICLQEVNHYGDFFLPLMEKQGYCGAFFCKPCSPAEQYGVPCDGCALFYRSSRFENCCTPQGHTFASMDGKSGNQGMLMVQLLDRKSGIRIHAATTHLKAKAGAQNDAIRDHQACQLLDELTAMCTGMSSSGMMPSDHSLGPAEGQSRSKQPIVFLCGDLNTTPLSSTCQLIAGHSLQLKSSWDSYPSISVQPGGEPSQQPFSTWKFRSDGETKRAIDYIWYSIDERLQLTSHWQLPSEQTIGSAGLPSLAYPSDHLALCCNFSISITQ